MSELSQLSPQPLWDIFAKICSIPHPSYHEEQLAEYIVGWAKEKGFHVERDQVGNILIRKPATAGMENRKPVVLQAHLDMVPQKNNDTVHDFTKDPIQPYIDGEWVKARGTTLGADNGIGMASALAVLADENVVHGPLEVLLTMTEEAGMDGAFGLQSNWLQADILINTDSEEEGEIYMGCAGGIDFTSNLHLDREAVPAGFETFKLTLKGLKGGHSGGEIHVGLGNANKLLVRFLAGHAEELDLRLIDFNGGTLRNAIPREAFATIAVAADKVDALKSLVNTYQEILKNELAEKEKNLALLLDSVANDKAALIAKSRDTFIRLPYLPAWERLRSSSASYAQPYMAAWVPSEAASMATSLHVGSACAWKRRRSSGAKVAKDPATPPPMRYMAGSTTQETCDMACARYSHIWSTAIFALSSP